MGCSLQPAAGDTFTIDLESVDKKDIFTAVSDLVTSIGAYSGNSPRLSYEIGVALTDIAAVTDRLSEVRSQVGAKLNLSENQKKSNDEFVFFADQSISEIEDLDIVSAISELVKRQISVEAAQRSIVQIQRLSLFDFI